MAGSVSNGQPKSGENGELERQVRSLDSTLLPDGRLPRASGILLHPTSLPGGHGIGDLGAEAYRFVDFLAASRQSIWQVLPLNPTGMGCSPYAAPSAFAGNPLLISLDRLMEEGLISPADLAGAHRFAAGHVDYQRVRAFKMPCLYRAFQRFKAGRDDALHAECQSFCMRNADWLEDHALFMALKEAHHEEPWMKWEPDLVRLHPEGIARARAALAEQVEFHCFLQFLFDQQWEALRRYAHGHGVRIVGDIPIFVAQDSVDVWAHRALFAVNERGQPSVVAGVPPDYFSATGQRWGNPLYRWETLGKTGYQWWIARFRRAYELVDAVRLDHFRGFQAYWEIPAARKTARQGRWVAGPGEALFRAVEAALGPLPIIVEDLGLITPDVLALRDRLGYPGMKVLQFAFGGDATNPYLPHNYERNCVVYTATHDNDTTAGWLGTIARREHAAVRRYLGTSGHHAVWELIRLALGSVANTAIVPLQDVLGLGSEARMNYPGRLEGNWAWRLKPGQIKAWHAEQLGALTGAYGRDLALSATAPTVGVVAKEGS